MMGEFVRILKPKVVRCGGPGADTVGYFDMSRCADHVFQQCHRKACIGYNGDHSGGHRRAQSPDSCDMDELAWRTEDITAACCEEAAEGGRLMAKVLINLLVSVVLVVLELLLSVTRQISVKS